MSFLKTPRPIKNTIIISAISTHALIETNTSIKNSIKMSTLFLRHALQRGYDRFPGELCDIPRGKTLFTGIPIVPGTLSYRARIADCASKIVFWCEIGFHGNTVKENAKESLITLLDGELPTDIDIHTSITLLSLFIGTAVYYGIIKPSDAIVEFKRRNINQ